MIQRLSSSTPRYCVKIICIVIVRLRMCWPWSCMLSKSFPLQTCHLHSHWSLPFPSSYKNSHYSDCSAHQVWNYVKAIKNELTRLLGQYLHQQGHFGREQCHLANVTSPKHGTSQSGNSETVQSYRLWSVISNPTLYNNSFELTSKAARLKRGCTIAHGIPNQNSPTAFMQNVWGRVGNFWLAIQASKSITKNTLADGWRRTAFMCCRLWGMSVVVIDKMCVD